MSEEQTSKRRPRVNRQQGTQRAGLRPWVSAALGAFVLVVSGFLLGLALGVVSEEPDIVASHLVGSSEPVEWQEELPEAPQAPAEVSAAPIMEPEAPVLPVVASADPVPDPQPLEVAPVAPTSQVPPPVAAPAVSAAPQPRATPGWVIQVGAFSRSSSADALAESLKAKGFNSFLQPSAGPADGRWRVRVGPLPTQSEAQRVARRLEREESLSTWVLSEGGS